MNENGKRPTREQKTLMEINNFSPNEYLVVKNLPHAIEIVKKSDVGYKKPETIMLLK